METGPHRAAPSVAEVFALESYPPCPITKEMAQSPAILEPCDCPHIRHIFEEVALREYIANHASDGVLKCPYTAHSTRTINIRCSRPLTQLAEEVSQAIRPLFHGLSVSMGVDSVCSITCRAITCEHVDSVPDEFVRMIADLKPDRVGLSEVESLFAACLQKVAVVGHTVSRAQDSNNNNAQDQLVPSAALDLNQAILHLRKLVEGLGKRGRIKWETATFVSQALSNTKSQCLVDKINQELLACRNSLQERNRQIETLSGDIATLVNAMKARDATLSRQRQQAEENGAGWACLAGCGGSATLGIIAGLFISPPAGVVMSVYQGAAALGGVFTLFSWYNAGMADNRIQQLSMLAGEEAGTAPINRS